MTTHAKKSLMNIYPRHFEVPLLILASLGTFLVALTLPLMEIEKKILWKHWRNDYSVVTGVKGLFDEKEYVLALVLFFFSVVFPVIKFVALSVIWVVCVCRKPSAKNCFTGWGYWANGPCSM